MQSSIRFANSLNGSYSQTMGCTEGKQTGINCVVTAMGQGLERFSTRNHKKNSKTKSSLLHMYCHPEIIDKKLLQDLSTTSTKQLKAFNRHFRLDILHLYKFQISTEIKRCKTYYTKKNYFAYRYLFYVIILLLV